MSATQALTADVQEISSYTARYVQLEISRPGIVRPRAVIAQRHAASRR